MSSWQTTIIILRAGCTTINLLHGPNSKSDVVPIELTDFLPDTPEV